MELGKHVITGLKVGALLRLVAQIFTWLNTLILIRLLSQDDYGLMAMTLAFIGIFAIMGDFGVAKAVIQAEKLTNHLLRQAFTLNLFARIFFFALFFSAAPFIAEFFEEPKITALVQAIACQNIVLIFHTLPYALASRNMLFKQREKVQFAATVFTSIITIALAAYGMGVWSLIIGHLVLRTSLTIGFIWIAPCWVWPTLKFKGFKSMAGFSGIATINDALYYLIDVFGSISVGKLLNKGDLGVFSVARNLANLPGDKIGELLNHLGLASFSKLQQDNHGAGRYLYKSVHLASSILFPMYFGMYAVAPELITLILSDKWAVAIIPFQILCLSSPLVMLSDMLSTAITAMGKPIKNSQVLMAKVLMLPMFFYGVQYGIEGACWSWLTISFLGFLIYLDVTLPVFHLRSLQLLKALTSGLVSAAIMLGGLLLLRHYYADAFNPWLFLPLTILSGVILFLAAQLLLFRQQFFSTLRYLRH